MSTTQDVTENKRYRDAEWLREQYVEKDCSEAEIAEKCGVCASTINRWRNKFDIEGTDTAALGMHELGYERWRCQAGGTYDEVLVHRLLATLKVDELSDLDGMHVYCELNILWDNRLDNLHILTTSEHQQRHS